MSKQRNIYIELEDCYELKILYLSNYYSTYFDKEDFEKLSKYKWRINNDRKRNTMYVHRHGGSIHREIMPCVASKVIDHIDKNGLNNRKANLRSVSISLNNRNMNVRKDNTSGMIGVYFSNSNNQWRAKWYDSNKKMCQKAFSVNKYGYEESKQMASSYRLNMIKQNEYIYDEKMYEKSSETIPLD